MEQYEYPEEIGTGDVSMVSRGKSFDTLFQNAAIGLSEVMVETKGVRPDIPREVSLSEGSIERLLYQWLSELVYFKDAESLLFSRFEVEVHPGAHYRLNGLAMGECIDRGRHHLRNDVKAVTLHRFRVKLDDGVWEATMVFDL